MIHELGRVHADVAPNNILDVDGRWKLADLDRCVPVDAPLESLPPRAYAAPGAEIGSPARVEYDEWSLGRVLARISGDRL